MERLNVGQELLNVPMGEMVKSLALGIATAQWELDKSSMTVAELMSGQRLLRDLDSGKLVDHNGRETTTPTVIDSRVFFGYTYGVGDKKGGGKIAVRTPQKLSMLELGFVPVFYQFVDTIIEVKISITMQGTQEDSRDEKSRSSGVTVSHSSAGCGWWWYNRYRSSRYSVDTRTSTVDAKFSSKYSYSIEGSSLLRTKLVPVPPPSILEERIRDVMEDETIWRDWVLKGLVNETTGVVDEDKVKEMDKAGTLPESAESMK